MSNQNNGNGGVTDNSAASGMNYGVMGNGSPQGARTNAGNYAVSRASAGYGGNGAPYAATPRMPPAGQPNAGCAAPNGVASCNADTTYASGATMGYGANGTPYAANHMMPPAGQENAGCAAPSGVLPEPQSNTTNPKGKVILKPFTFNGDGSDDVVHNDLYFGPSAPPEAIATNIDQSALIKPSLQELGEILQYIPSSQTEHRKKICLCLGTAYNQDPKVADLLKNWLNDQYAIELLSFHRKKPSSYQLDEVLLLAQKGGYQIPDKFQPWLQVASAEGAKHELLTRLTSELSLKDFERQINAELLTLGEQVLSYWLCACEDDKARFTFLSSNYNRFCFFHPEHQPIISALFTYCKERQESESPYIPFNYPSFIYWVEHNNPDKVSLTTIEQICQSKLSLFSRVNANECMELLYHKSWRLHTILAAKDLIAKLQTTTDYDLGRQARTAFIAASQGAEQEPSLGIDEMGDNTHETISNIIDDQKRMQLWVPSGYKLIDDAIFGYHRGGITIFAGSSGTGKTWFGIDATFKLIEKYKRHALFFSTEMDVSSIALRYFGLVTNSKIGVNSLCYAHKQGELPKMEEAFRNFTQRHFSYQASPDQLLNLHATNNLNEHLRIYGTEVGLTLSKIVNLINEESSKAPLDLVVIDYLQNIENDLLPPDCPRYMKLKHMVDVLKTVAQDCNCAILLLAQLTNPASWGNRKRKDEPAIPAAKDIAECSYAIHAAAAVLMMYKVSDSLGFDGMFASSQQKMPANPTSYDLKDEEIFDDSSHLHRVPLRLIITKARFGSSVLKLDSPMYVERSTGSRFNFYL